MPQGLMISSVWMGNVLYSADDADISEITHIESKKEKIVVNCNYVEDKGHCMNGMYLYLYMQGMVFISSESH